VPIRSQEIPLRQARFEPGPQPGDPDDLTLDVYLNDTQKYGFFLTLSTQLLRNVTLLTVKVVVTTNPQYGQVFLC
jgi:hypothetical protein